MSQQEKPLKASKYFRLKAQEFLTSPASSNILTDIIQHFDSGADLSSCILALELIFTSLLRNKQMVIEITPLQPTEGSPENEYKMWLLDTYQLCFNKILSGFENKSSKVQLQALSTCMNILASEGRTPLESKGNLTAYVPLSKLKFILMKLLSNKQNNEMLITKYSEFLQYDDILFFTWKILPSLTAKCNPNDVYIMNYLLLLERLHVQKNENAQYLCSDGSHFTFEEAGTKRALNKIWHCVMLWEHTPLTHKQLLIVLLQNVLPHLEKPLLMTDFLMDSMDVGGPISLLALNGIFTMIQVHNLNYPNIFAKLYSMFEPEIFHTKYKARLFYLCDMFMRSTHLPENLVAAFAKRLARLALVAPSEDVIIICRFIGNLILRHPGLKCLLNNTSPSVANSDPYIMEECDPVKSNAINSSLWEIETLQHHVEPAVASAAGFINSPLPRDEWDLFEVLDQSSDDMFDKEVKKYSKLLVLAFNRPNGISLNEGEKVLQYWNL